MTKRDSIKGSTGSNGASVHLSARVPRPLWEKVEEWATSAGMPSSRALVRLAEIGLQTGAKDDENAAPSIVDASRGPRPKGGQCEHPRNQRRNLGYAVICGACGDKI